MYSRSLRWLHALMALMVLGLLISGIVMTRTENYDIYPIHKSFGFTVGVLILVRIVARQRSPIPALPASISPLLQKFARGVQYALYAGMIAMPVSGYAMSMLGGWGVTVFGVPLPNPFAKNSAAAELFAGIHEWAGYTLIALVVLHIVGALRHSVRKESVLSTMKLS